MAYSPLAYMFPDPPPRKGSAVADLPPQDWTSRNAESQDIGSVNESYRLLFPGQTESRFSKKVEGFRKCQWAYTSNHSYSGCTDLIARSIMLNGLNPGMRVWKLSPIIDEDGNAIKNPDKAQREPFLHFVRSCHKRETFDTLLTQIIHDLTKADASFAEVQLTKVKNPAGFGQPGGLSLLAQDEMRCRLDKHGELVDDWPFYQKKGRDETVDFRWQQVLLLTNRMARGKGYLPQTPADKIEVAINSSIEAEAFINSYFTSGAKMGMVFANPTWNKAKADAFMADIARDWTNSKTGHKPWMLYDHTTIHEPPRTAAEFAQYIEIQQYDVRKICSIFGMDSRIISSPGEGNMGGKGEREQIWSEFLIRCVNPRKRSISEQITNQILLQGFGIDQWRFELVQFRDAKDAASKLSEAQAYGIMINMGMADNLRLEDLKTIRNSINPDFTDPEEAEMADWPRRPGEGEGASVTPYPVDAPGVGGATPDMKLDPTSGARNSASRPSERQQALPVLPPQATGQRMKRLPRPIERRAPRKQMRALVNDWLESTLGQMKPAMKAALEKGIALFAKAYDRPVDEKMAAMRAIDNPFPKSGQLRSSMVREFKAHFAASKALCEKELEYHASTLDDDAKDKRTGEQLRDAGPGGIADFISSLGEDEFGEMYNKLLKTSRDTFRLGFQEGWPTDKFVAKLTEEAEGYTEIALTQIVRDASNDLFTQARLQAGAESDIVAGYEISSIEDDRLCPVCEALDGLQFPAHFRFAHPPFHPNCRCTVNYILQGEPVNLDEAAYVEAKAGIAPGYGGVE